MDYENFLERKRHSNKGFGFDPLWLSDTLYDFQKHLVELACRKGRFAIFADCGLGKTGISFTWSENIARKTGGRVLVLAPLAVAFNRSRRLISLVLMLFIEDKELNKAIESL